MEFTTVDDREVMCIPLSDGHTRTWIMLKPQSPPFYKQMPQGAYTLAKSQVEALVRTHEVSSTVEEVLWSHVQAAE